MARSVTRVAGGVQALVLMLVLAVALAGCGSGNSAAHSPGTTATLTPTVENDVQVFNVVGLRTLQFSAAELIAKPGRIKVNFSVEEQSAPHNFVIPEIPEARTSILSAGSSESINFVAGERGSYSVICTLHPNMLATLKIV